jgi:hypothetical protein
VGGPAVVTGPGVDVDGIGVRVAVVGCGAGGAPVEPEHPVSRVAVKTHTALQRG